MTDKINALVKYAVWLNEARLYLDTQLEAYDLPRQEWLILALLRINPNGISQAYAKKYLAVETSYFSKILNKLEDKHYIERVIDKDDRRNRIIKVNPKPHPSLNKIFKIIHDFNSTLESNLSDSELQALNSCITKLESTLTKLRNLT